METMNCSQIRDSLIRHLNAGIEVGTLMNQCVFTLPIRSLDDRSTEVFIEDKLGGFYRVHDAGITSSHLFAQGIHITEHKAQLFEEMAQRLGAAYTDGTFEKSCRLEEIENAILAVSQCAALASIEVAAHKPNFRDEPIINRVER